MRARHHRTTVEACNCLALQQASRHLTQFYNQTLAATGLRVTQYSILAKVAKMGAPTINELAGVIAMDRTTMGQNLRPLEKQGLISITVGKDRRSRKVVLTPTGERSFSQASSLWRQAQDRFETEFGAGKAEALRAMLHEVAATGFYEDERAD